MEETLTGKLLVASPALVDPNFQRTVVLMCSHREDGALGLVLNRPLWDLEVGDALPDWRAFVAEPPVLFRGGPVEPNAALALGRVKAEPGSGWTRVLDRVGLVNLGEPGSTLVEMEVLRIYSGYAGWTGGQLEGEIKQGSWFVVDAQPDDPFGDESDGLWRRVLQRQTGKLAMFAHFPQDPRAN